MNHNIKVNKLFESKYGYFSPDGKEYIITRPDTPRPWTNIISNSDYGLIVSQAGGGFSWRSHVSLNRLTRWSQDMVRDDWGKWLYLRDLDSGEWRSLAYQPVQAPYDTYQVRHGLGYSVFEQRYKDLETSWTIFAAKDDPVEIWICRLVNHGQTKKRLQLSSYLEWNLGAGPDINREFHKIFIETAYLPQVHAITAQKYLWEMDSPRGHWNINWPHLAFHSVNRNPESWDASKDALLGRLGTYRNPAGIKAGKLSGASGRFEDAAAALSTTVELAPASEQTIVFLLGQIDYDPGRAMDVQIQPFVEKYAAPAAAEQELQRVKAHWAELTGHSQVQTPDDSFNFLVNTWLKYQAISGHLWARTGYYQQSGAFGFRDQLQTSQVWLTIQPERMLEHIKMNARHQLQSGVVLHWWHPLSDKGLLTDMTDDLLWLPFMLSRYCDETGNLASLDEVAPYYDGGQGTLLEHSLKAIDVVLQRFSPRGLPLIGAGDWCDGFSAVGLDWKGESIWLGMFLFSILKSWAEILQRTNTGQNIAKAAEYLSRAEKLRTAINEYGWNGQWYIAATKDDGEPIGDISNQECKIYLNSQTWSILTGIADPERQEQVKQAMFERLESDNGMLLLAPAYSVPDTFIGYITRYAPGLRENGGVYTHAATWSVMALAHMGLADDAMRIFRKLNPILQAESDIERYMAEPYVLPGNIDGPDSKYYGRAGWSWYTGSAGWLLTIAMDYIAGARAAKEGLMINPCMPRDWPQIKIKRRFRNAVYHIIINNPKQITGKVKTMKLNGQTIAGNIIPTQPPGEYQVEAEITE